MALAIEGEGDPMAQDYRIISSDSHLQVAAERWTPHVPAKYRDHAPHTVELPDGGHATVVVEGRNQIFHGGLTGRPYENRWPNGGRFDTSPGAGSPEQRLREQDIDGVDGEIMFTYPAGIGYYRGIKDDAVYKAMIHAWNEWLAEEYCPVAPERLVGMGMLPDTGLQDAVDELEYCARMGLKGVCLNKYPSGEDVPTAEDDRFWAASLDHNMPLAVHVCFAGGHSGSPAFPHKHDPKEVSSGVDAFTKFTMYAVRGAGNALQMIFSGVFDRFPGLRIYFAETQVGWIPNFLEILDDQYDRHIHWAERLLEMKKLDRLPSEYVREHFSWGFMRNAVGVRNRHEIGVERMLWATDFPHAESDWPESQHIIQEIFAGVPEDEKRRMLGGNAVEYFHLDPTPPERSEAPVGAAAVS
jgi:predicted TIM-barrel fold metal-dependent hydrolase